MSTCNWPLGNGQTLAFEIYTANTKWADIAGLYIFSYLSQDGRWRAVYVGQTNSFVQRLPTHEQLAPAGQLGATHIHTVVVTQQIDRDRLEAALIQHLQPPLNEHHR